jgi:hypothetical protein
LYRNVISLNGTGVSVGSANARSIGNNLIETNIGGNVSGTLSVVTGKSRVERRPLVSSAA